MKIQWLTGLASNQVCLSPQTLSENQMIPGKMMLHFGAWFQEVTIISNKDIPDGVLGLPFNLKGIFTIPDHISYDFYKNGTDLYLGPLIALIAFAKHDEITTNKLNHHLDYFRHFGKGLLFICAVDGIDTKKKIMKGYYYSPELTSNGWKVGVFPYPGAAYNRAKITREIFDDLALETNNRIFNSFSNGSFNKWELWKRLAPIQKLKPHLPHTIPFTNVRRLSKMLNRYGCVYLKPAGGTLSKGIIKVQKTPDGSGYHLFYPNRKKGGKGTIQKNLEDRKKINKWVRGLKQKDYLIQQAIAMKVYEQMPIDFRVIMQKNNENKWECTGIFSKYGKKGSIITNFSRSGFLLSGIESFRLAFAMNEMQAQNKIDELTDLSYEICNTFDMYGQYGDIGIDLMVDQYEKVWILEVNTLDTYHRFPLHSGDKELYEKVIKNPLIYAKFLAGF